MLNFSSTMLIVHEKRSGPLRVVRGLLVLRSRKQCTALGNGK